MFYLGLFGTNHALTFVTINEIFCNSYNCLCEKHTHVITCKDLPDLGKMHMATIMDAGVYQLKMLRPQNPFLVQSIEKYFKNISVMNSYSRLLDNDMVTPMDTGIWFNNVTTELPLMDIHLDKPQNTTRPVIQEDTTTDHGLVWPTQNNDTRNSVSKKHLGNIGLVFTVLTGVFIGVTIGLIICCGYYQKKYRNLLSVNSQRARNQIFLQEI